MPKGGGFVTQKGLKIPGLEEVCKMRSQVMVPAPGHI